MGNFAQLWPIQGDMIQGDLVKLKTKYPIWLYSQGLKSGDMGIIIKLEKSIVTVYWLRIKKTGSIMKDLLLPVE